MTELLIFLAGTAFFTSVSRHALVRVIGRRTHTQRHSGHIAAVGLAVLGLLVAIAATALMVFAGVHAAYFLATDMALAVFVHAPAYRFARTFCGCPAPRAHRLLRCGVCCTEWHDYFFRCLLLAVSTGSLVASMSYDRPGDLPDTDAPQWVRDTFDETYDIVMFSQLLAVSATQLPSVV